MLDLGNNGARKPFLRIRNGHHARVTFEELFFDLIYVFAVTQISHKLLHDLTFHGVLETLILWFAVWLGWQYTCWTTNWFNPETPRVRGMMFGVMLLALVMAASIPEAYGSHGLVFAIAFATMQIGRTAFILWLLPQKHDLSLNHIRMIAWLAISGALWIGGGLADDSLRITLWGLAALCEYVSPMFGFALPGLGRSNTKEWTIEGAHLTERCRLFVIVALGETLLASGAMFSKSEWTPPLISALLATFFGTLAMWWLYFGTTGKDATDKITQSDDPGRIGAYFHYVHAVLVAGIIGSAVANDLVLEHPHHAYSPAYTAVIIGGPALYLFGSALYKKIVYGGKCATSHLVGIIGLFLLIPLSFETDILTIGWATTIVLLMISFWDIFSKSFGSNKLI